MNLASSLLFLLFPLAAHGASTLWTFGNAGNPLAAASGTAVLAYHDPNADNWGPALTSFAKASALGLPALPGGDADVMSFPACI